VRKWWETHFLWRWSRQRERVRRRRRRWWWSVKIAGYYTPTFFRRACIHCCLCVVSYVELECIDFHFPLSSPFPLIYSSSFSMFPLYMYCFIFYCLWLLCRVRRVKAVVVITHTPPPPFITTRPLILLLPTSSQTSSFELHTALLPPRLFGIAGTWWSM